jgi:multiple sugar transport system permease protein
MKQKSSFALSLAIILVSFVILSPLFVMVSTSLKLKTQIFSNDFSFFFVPTLTNFQAVLEDGTNIRFLTNSLIIALASTALTLTFGTLAAYAIVRFQFMGRDTISVSTLLLRMVPPAVLTIPVFSIWTYQYGLTNTLSGVILVYTAINLPFVIWIMQSFIQNVPLELEEAAMIDGASPLQVFYHAVLPVIAPGLAAAAIFTFRIAWNEFILSLVLTNRFTRTMPVKVSLFINEHNIEWGQIMAIGTLIAIPPLIFTFLAAKQIITGLTAGAVKG